MARSSFSFFLRMNSLNAARTSSRVLFVFVSIVVLFCCCFVCVAAIYLTVISPLCSRRRRVSRRTLLSRETRDLLLGRCKGTAFPGIRQISCLFTSVFVVCFVGSTVYRVGDAAGVGAGPVPARTPGRAFVATFLWRSGPAGPSGWHGACPYISDMPHPYKLQNRFLVSWKFAGESPDATRLSGWRIWRVRIANAYTRGGRIAPLRGCKAWNLHPLQTRRCWWRI